MSNVDFELQQTFYTTGNIRQQGKVLEIIVLNWLWIGLENVSMDVKTFDLLMYLKAHSIYKINFYITVGNVDVYRPTISFKQVDMGRNSLVVWDSISSLSLMSELALQCVCVCVCVCVWKEEGNVLFTDALNTF